MYGGEKGNAYALLNAIFSPNFNREYKFVIGFYKDKELIGLIDLIKDHPQDDIWFIGYLLILPQFRHLKIGTKLVLGLSPLASKMQKKLQCIVQKQNPDALRFWLKNGFTFINEEEEVIGNKKIFISLIEKNLEI